MPNPVRLTKKEKEKRLEGAIDAAMILRRQVLGVPDEKAICAAAILDVWHEVDPHCQIEQKQKIESYRAAAKVAQGLASGVYIPSRGKSQIWVTNDTIVAARDMNPDARFVIAHELGHRVNQHKGIKYDFTRALDRKLYKPEESQDELEADFFAAAFLAPPSRLDSFANLEAFADFYGLPIWAARNLRRLMND